MISDKTSVLKFAFLEKQNSNLPSVPAYREAYQHTETGLTGIKSEAMCVWRLTHGI